MILLHPRNPPFVSKQVKPEGRNKTKDNGDFSLVPCLHGHTHGHFYKM
jgi:hypothetical protein